MNNHNYNNYCGCHGTISLCFPEKKTAPFILVDNGTVTTLISRPDPVVANLFFLNKDIFEFPVVFCISSEEFSVS